MVKNIPSGDFVENEHFLTGSGSFLALLRVFSEGYKVPLAFFDGDGNQLSPSFGTAEFCERYAHFDAADKVPKSCLKFHKELFSSAREKKKYRLAKCPLGIYCFSIPLLIDGRLIGIIAGGHMLSQVPAEEFSYKLLSSGNGELWDSYRRSTVLRKREMEEALTRLDEALRVSVREAQEKFQCTRQLKKLIFGSRINEMVNTKMKLEELLKHTTEEIADAVEVEICLILLWDKERNDFSLFATNMNLPADQADMKFQMGEGVTGIVASTGKPVIIRDAMNDHRVIYKSLGIKSLLTVPLKVGENSIGVLHVGTLKEIRDFSQRELELVEALSSEAALAVNNTRLYEEGIKKTQELKRSKEELQSYFSQIGTALSSALNLQQLLRTIVEMSVKLMAADAGSLYLIEDRKLSSQVSLGFDNDMTRMARFRLRESLLGWDNNGHDIPGRELSKKSTEFFYGGESPRESIRAYLGIPLAIKDEIIGLLNLYSREKKDFQPDRVELLSAFANQAVMAIDNAMNFEKEQKRAKEATLLYEAARAIGSSFELQEILDISVKNLTEITLIDRCLLFLYDDKKKEFYTASHTGLSLDQREFFSYFRIFSHEISQDIWDDLTKGKPRLFSSPPPGCPALEKLFNLFPTNSCLLVPLIAREKLMGIVYLDDSQMAHYFSDSQIRMIMTLSIQIATTIQRSRLITKQEENTNQLKALLQVSSVLPSSLSLPKVFNLVVEKAAQLVSRPSVALLIMDDAENDFTLQAHRGLDDPLMDSELQKNIAQQAVDKKRHTIMFIEKEPEEEIAKALWNSGVGGAISIPLIAKRRLVGVLNCFCDIGHQFSFEEIRLLRSYANHAAIAVENARLHGVVRAKVRELATLFEVGKAITSSLQFDRVMEEIAKNIKRVMNADACSIMLLDEEHKELSIQTAIGLQSSAPEQKIKLGEGVAGIAAKTGRPMILLDKQEKKSLYKFPKSLRDQGLRTILSVPLETKGRIIGLINIYLKDIYYYKPLEINLLVALANQAAIAIENARLYEQQYRVAQILQAIVMPMKEFHFPGIEIGYLYISSLELSGDYFDLIPLSNTKLSLVIADVSGKGPPAAIYTVRAKYVLKSYAIAGYQPREILSMVNNMIVPETGDDKFISLFYIEVDLKKKLLRFSSAGHEPPIFCCQKTRELTLLETEGLLIGISYDAKFKQEEIAFENGDVLVLYTDGITEARGAKKEIFGIERLMEIVKKHAHLEPQALAQRIYTAVQKYTRRKLNDDFSLLVVRL
jgi:phosphoserine phosphatase RsbU/P